MPHSPSPRPANLAVYVQHLLGTGHLVRAAAIAREAARRGHAVMLLTGGAPVPMDFETSVDAVQLPPIRAKSDGSWTLETLDGAPVSDAIWGGRTSVIESALEKFQPDVLMIEHFPFGRRAFTGEILPMIARARRANSGLHVVASVRDIVQPPKSAERAQEIAACVNEIFDRVLVHGDPSVAEFGTSFPATESISRHIYYTGHIDAGASHDAKSGGAGRQGVVVSAGGGRVGAALLQAAARARIAGLLENEPWTFIVGRSAEAGLESDLRNLLPGREDILTHAEDFRARLRQARLSISQAGYNTVVDILAARVPAVLQPYAEFGEQEQMLRARSLVANGFPVTISESGDDLAAAATRAMDLSRDMPAINLNGLKNAVDALEEIAASARLVVA